MAKILSEVVRTWNMGENKSTVFMRKRSSSVSCVCMEVTSSAAFDEYTSVLQVFPNSVSAASPLGCAVDHWTLEYGGCMVERP